MAYKIIDPRIWIAIGYKRRSREDMEAERFGRHETLAKQHRLLELVARDDYDLEITEWFEEIESGETIAGRPEFTKLLQALMTDRWKAASQGKRIALFAKEPARLGRCKGADRDRILNVLKHSQTYFVTPEKVYDPDNPKDLKLLRKELEDAADELEVSTIRLNGGVKDVVREGGCPGGIAPYGWDKKRINRRWRFVPHDVNHPRLMTMLDLVDHEGYTVGDVKRHAEEQQWPAPDGTLIWKKATIRSLLCSDVNAGYVTHGRHKTVLVVDENFDEHKIRRVVGDDDPDLVRVRGAHYGNGTISEERLERIRRKVHTGLPVSEERELKNMFSNVLRCGKCGYAMIRRQQSSRYYKDRSGRPYVRIEHPDDVKADCDCKGAPYELVLNCLVEALKARYGSLELLLTDEGRKKDRARTEKMVRRLAAELETAKKACDKIRYAWETDRYTDAEYDERIAVAKAQVAAIEKNMAEQLASIPDEETIAEQMTTCGAVLDTLLDDSLSVRAKNDLLRKWIDHIDYYNDAPPRVRRNEIRLDIFFA